MKTKITLNGFDYLVDDEAEKPNGWYLPFGTWYIDDANQIRQSIINDAGYWSLRKNYREILSTNDPELIKSGVLSMDDFQAANTNAG